MSLSVTGNATAGGDIIGGSLDSASESAEVGPYVVDIVWDEFLGWVEETDTTPYTLYWSNVTGNLTLGASLIPALPGYSLEGILPWSAVPYLPSPAQQVANITGQVVAVNPYGTDAPTLIVAGGNTVSYANLTGNAGGETIKLTEINSLGLGLRSGKLWLNGKFLQMAEILSRAALLPNEDGTYRLNLAALGVNATMANPQLAVNHLSGNLWRATGYIYDAGNLSATPRAVLLTPNSYGGVALAVDLNRDGEISFDVDDETSSHRPFRFWVNNDRDGNSTVSGETDVQDDLFVSNGTIDFQKNAITHTRDLEDFARLWIDVGGAYEEFGNGTYYIGFKWRVPNPANQNPFLDNEPAIKLYRAVAEDGGGEYLTDPGVAQDQVVYSGNFVSYGNFTGAITDYSDSAANATIVAYNGNNSLCDFVLPSSVFEDLDANHTVAHLLFEGCGRGRGQLQMVVLGYDSGNDTFYEVTQAGGVWLDLDDLKEMYERWTVGDGNGLNDTLGGVDNTFYNEVLSRTNNTGFLQADISAFTAVNGARLFSSVGAFTPVPEPSTAAALAGAAAWGCVLVWRRRRKHAV